MEAEAPPVAKGSTGMIKLVSSDGVELEISHHAAELSGFLSNALSLEDETEEERTGLEVDVRVGSKTLSDVVHYLEYYKDTKMKDIADPTKDVIPATFDEVVPQEWYRQYVEALGLDGLWRVRSAAHFMLIEPLTYLTNTWLAFHLLDKSMADMYDILHIPKMTPDEEQKARQDHPWLFLCLEEELPPPDGEEAAAAADDNDEDDADDDDDEDE